jgi:hypothetical protein
LPVVYVDIPAFAKVGVVVGVALCFGMAFGYNFAIFILPFGCFVYLYIALSTTFGDNVEVALSVCGGVVRFLDELQKTCVVCVIHFQWITPDRLLHLYLDVVSMIPLLHRLDR